MQKQPAQENTNEMLQNENVNPIPSAQKENKKSGSLTTVLLSVLGTLVVLLGAYFVYDNFISKDSSPGVLAPETGTNQVEKETPGSQTEESQPSESEESLNVEESEDPVEEEIVEEDESADTSDWKTYTSDQYEFSFKYPPNYNLKKLSYGYEPFYPFEEDVPATLEITRDVYEHMAQNPAIKVIVISTDKNVSGIIEDLKDSIAKSIEDLDDPDNIFFGMDISGPEIFGERNITVAGIPMAEIDRFGGPGAPNVDFLEYYFEHKGYIILFQANWSRHGADPATNGSIEKADVQKVIETFTAL